MKIAKSLEAALQIIGARSVEPRLGALNYIVYKVVGVVEPDLKVVIRRGSLYYEFGGHIETCNLEWLTGNLYKAFKFFEHHEAVSNTALDERRKKR